MNLTSISNALLKQYKKRSKNNRPFIMGVDGLGGAGKTTFVKKLGKDLKEKGYDVITIHIDNHIVVSEKRYRTGYEEWFEYYFLQWDIKLLQTELFQKLYDGNKLIILPLYDRKTDTESTYKVYMAPNSIVLIEGVFIQRQEWRAFFDFVIFIDCPTKDRIERVLNRDTYIGDYQDRLNKYQRRYWTAEENYVKMEDPFAKADVIFNSINTD